MEDIFKILRSPEGGDGGGAGGDGGSEAGGQVGGEAGEGGGVAVAETEHGHEASVSIVDKGGESYKEPEGINFADVVPEEFKDKPYLKDVTDFHGLFKKLDGAQTLIGKRPAGIPQENASKEEWDKFYATLGRPEKAEDYEFGKSVEGLQYNEDLANQVKGIFHKHGLNSKQAKGIQEDYEQVLLATLKAQGGIQDTEDIHFDQLADDTFGKDKKDGVIDLGRRLIEANAPEGFKEKIPNLPAEALILFSGVLQNLANKYISEDEIPNIGGEGSRGGGGETAASLRAEAEKLMQTEAYTNAWHTENEETVKKVRELFDRAAKLEAASGKA